MHRKIYFHAHENDKSWIYLDIFGWLVFDFFRHGGWFYLNFSWFKQQLKEEISRKIRVLKNRLRLKMNNQNLSQEEVRLALEKQQALAAKRIISLHQQVALAMMTGQLRPNQEQIKPDK